MSSCPSFVVTFAGDAAAQFEHVRQAVAEHGGTLTGNAVAGSCTIPIPLFGEVAGTYTVTGQELTVTVTHKPWLLPCHLIMKFFSEHTQHEPHLRKV